MLFPVSSGKPLKPTWSHSLDRFGPWRGPPTPTQPATWPDRIPKLESGVTVAPIPKAGEVAARPA
jgi:hypothetical protein